MQKKYYIEIAMNYERYLADLAKVYPSMSEEAKTAVLRLLNALGFAYDLGDKEFVRLDDGIQSVWDIRKYSKKLIVQKDFCKFIEENIDLDLDEYTEDEVDEAVEFMSTHPDYNKYLHLPEDILVYGVEYLTGCFDDDDEDDDTDPDCCFDPEDEVCQGCKGRECKKDDDEDNEEPSQKVVVVHVKATAKSTDDNKPEELKPKTTAKTDKKTDKKTEKRPEPIKKSKKAEEEDDEDEEVHLKADILDTIVALVKELIAE